ncbi:MAG: hypothetical protein JW787_16985 [Sedimentisphaerales bacterium]|nr:hypothetical protein [Sedimentisphaerales bacterium]
MKSLKEVEKLIKRFRINSSVKINKKTLADALKAQEEVKKTESVPIKLNIWRNIMGSKVGSLAAAFLIISSLAFCFILSRKNDELRNELYLAQRDITSAPIDDSVTINFYLEEHQDFIARQAALNSAASEPMQMQIHQDDILYYESFDNQSELIRPGMIVRGQSSQSEVSTSEPPAISNGHTLTISEARETANFNLVSPSWIRLSYTLDQIRRIEDSDAFQLLYTDGINSISLFEQPLDGYYRLEPKDFREYAVFQYSGQGGGTILAWRDNALSYVLIGNIEMSQLMDIAQSISTRNKR